MVLYRALDELLGAPQRDWIAESQKAREKAKAQAKLARDKQLAAHVLNTTPSLVLNKYAGVYTDSLYGDVNVKETNGKLSLTYGNTIDAMLEHWHYDTFVATASSVTVGKLMTTFALGADGKVKTVELQGLGVFGRRPEPVDSARRAVGAQR